MYCFHESEPDSRPPPVSFSPPKAPPTPHQQQKLTELWAQLGWDQQRRMGFARRVCGAPWPQNRRDAGKVIEALKAMLQRGYTGERAGGDHA